MKYDLLTILTTLTLCISGIVSAFYWPSIIEYILSWILLLWLIGMTILFVRYLVKKKWRKAIISGCGIFVLLICGAFISFCTLFGFTPDKFTWNLGPTNHSLPKPFEQGYTSSDTIFALIEDSQPGIYSYDLYLGKMDSSTVYLKAFELTKNRQLSPHELREMSEMDIFNPNDSTTKFQGRRFTIYEGSWGEYYGARFEVWVKPKNGDDYKLTEANYLIEGWQR